MTNFIFVGSSLVSYALDAVATNHKNVEFKAYFKNEEGKEVTTLEKEPNQEETYLYVKVEVKKEGYFNGEITIENSNFNLIESESSYVSKIENNTLYLNQINVGTTEEIKIKIQPIQEENFAIGYLNMASKITLKGNYKDSTEKNINIQGSRELTLKLVENNNNEKAQNEIKVITNKIATIEGEEKRILQLSYQVGIQENNYPIHHIQSKISIPQIEGKQPNIEKIEYLNNMTKVDYKQNEETLEINLKNEANQEGKINWKKEGNETILITYVYDKDINLEGEIIKADQTMTLYDNKQIQNQKEITIGAEQLDGMLEIQAKKQEETIYKGKLKAGIDRPFETTTTMQVNYAKAISNIMVTEEQEQYRIGETTQEANAIYNKTILSKAEFEKLLGTEGSITIYNQNKEVIKTINHDTETNEEGNIVISYEGKNVTKIELQATKPIQEGTLTMHHTKTILGKANTVNLEQATELKNTITAGQKTVETAVKLEESETKANLEVSKESLSTVIGNNVEIKAILTSNNEKYDLYKNPEIAIQLPEQVENIQINSMDLLYENELKIKDYKVEDQTIKVTLEGEQTNYKEEAIEGATLIIGTTLDVNRKASTKEEAINMTYQNQVSSKNDQKPIKIVAPTDLTTIYSIQELGIETIGQEENKQTMIPRGQEEKQLEAGIEIINNNEEAQADIKIMGQFPTNSNNNNMGIEIVKEITIANKENVAIYYTENAEATDDIENAENEWTNQITDGKKVSKYLIIIGQMESGETLQGSYTYQIPAGLEYNQKATTKYQVTYTNQETHVQDQLESTEIEMQTGIGPKVEAKLTAKVAGKPISTTVKNGQIIRYQVEIANQGSEDVNNVKVVGKIPEGTKLVQPEENYEYTGASYYEELENKTYETTIETLKVGEVVNKEYEVRVENNTQEGIEISSIAQITYQDVTKTTEEIKNKVEKGNLRISVKRVTDRRVNLYTAGAVRYFAIIENISNQKQDNVKIKTNLPENLEVEVLSLITGMEKEEGNIYIINEQSQEATIEETKPEAEVQTEKLTYQEEVNIGSLEAGETKVLSYDMLIKQANSQTINFGVEAMQGQEKYPSNNWEDKVEKIEVGISMTAQTSGQYLKAGDHVNYTIVVENKAEAETMGLVVKDAIPSQLSINQVTKDGQVLEGMEQNNLDLPIKIEGNQTATLKVETVVNYSQAREKAEAITNVAHAEIYGEKVATTSEINHIIQANSSSNNNNNNDNNNQNPGQNENNTPNHVDNNDIAKGNSTITGIAWFDENKNGQKEAGEKLLNNIKVKLLNTETNNLVKEENGEILEATTNENGVYVLDKIGNGKYIAIFEYDNTQYALTKYKAEKIPENENSNAIMNELRIGDQKQQVAATDLLEIQGNHMANINIGLIPYENFDLALNKYVNKILIQNTKGSTVREYSKETVAKVELDAKTVSGSTVIIEYKIEVSNQGQVDGYAKKIADYVSSDLKFSSELNKDWYQVGDVLYTTSLANEKIKAGETKTVTLTLTKAMTEDNTGLVPNTAEIAEDYNELGVPDLNSTPGNRAKNENDLGLAEVVLSIRTGGIVYWSIGITIVGVIVVTAVMILKKKKNQEEQ